MYPFIHPNSFLQRVLLVIIIIIAGNESFAQSITNYAYTSTAGTFTALASPATTTWTGDADDGASALIPIGFDFWYMGLRYTDVSATTNGWLALGSIPTDFVYTNSLTNGGAPRPVIAPLWDDLSIVTTSNVTYKTSGVAGSRIFIVQYLNIKWDFQATGSVISFQVKFYETSGKIEFVYRSETASTHSPSGSIGITGIATGSGNFLSVNSNGNSVSSTTEANINGKPASGRTYAFTPAIPVTPGSLTFSGVSSTYMTLNWTDLSSNETGFAIYQSTDGVTYNYITRTAANVTSWYQAGLTVGITYYWRIFAVSEGGLSTVLSGNQITSCIGAPILSATTTPTCVGGSTGSITGVLTGGSSPFTYSLNTGTYRSSATFDTLAAASYTLNVKNGSGCIVSTIVTVNPFANSTDNENAAGTDSWIGHVYDGIIFNSYIGHYTETESFNESFTGSNTCFNVVSNGTTRSIFTDVFSVRYRMNSSKRGLYVVDLGSDDGGRLTVDGVMVYNNWVYQSFTLKPTVLINLTGSSSLQYEYFEGSGDNQVVYQNVIQVFSNSVTTNTLQGICVGNTGSAISGNTFGTLPTGVSLTGTGYQWSYSTSTGGARINISGATAATFTPVGTVAPFNVPGVYYVYRNALLTSANNLSVIPYAATNESDPAIITVNPAGQWSGSTSSDWAVGSNWCTGVVPTISTNVVINATAINMPTINASATCNQLTINSGASITTSTTGTLHLGGSIINNGTMTNNGTTSFEGTGGQQTFSGVLSFYNLTLNNTAGLLLPAAININHNLLLTAGAIGSVNFDLTVKGNWTNNASGLALVPGTNTVTFNGTGAQTIGGTFSTGFNNLSIANSGTAVSLSANENISGNLMVSTGTFDLGTFTANRTSAGGTLTLFNNTILKIGGTNSFPSNYATNTLVVASQVEYSGTNQSVANVVYGNLKLSSATGAAVKTFPATDLSILGNLSTAIGGGSSTSFTAASNLFINGNVSIGTSTTFNGGSFTHTIGGNWVNSGLFNGNTGTIIFTGTGTSVSGAGIEYFNNLTVAASLLSFSTDTIKIAGNLATTAIGSIQQAPGGIVLMSGTTKTIDGPAIKLSNLDISGTITTSSSLNIAGNLFVTGSFIASAGAITMSGNSNTISGTGTKKFIGIAISGTISTDADMSIASNLTVMGSLTATAGTTTFTDSSTFSGIANLYNVTINGTSLQLSANANLGIGNILNISAGVLNVTSSVPNTLLFNGSGAQTINPISYNNLVLSNGNTKSASGSFIVNGNLSIGFGTSFVGGNYKHYIYHDWTNNGSFTAGTGTIQFLGDQTTHISGPTTFNTLEINNTNATTSIDFLSNVTAGTVNMILGIIHTGSDTLTITSTRTGNGIIFGNICRLHSFTTGIAYAFEGPDNSVLFSAVSGVTSITVSVKSGPVSDFPFGGSASRLYGISVPAGTYTATLRLHYEHAELNGSVESSVALWQFNGSAWSAIGKSGNSTTLNYVEKSGLTNITNRWTFSDNSNVVQWNGSTSTNWNTAGNWTVVQGSASTPPSSSDIVNLGTIAFTYPPSIGTAVAVKNLNFGSTQQLALSLIAGGSLVTGDVRGTWTATATHSINIGKQSMTINGDLTLSDSLSNHSINIVIDTGSLNILGSLTQSGNASLVFNAAGKLYIGGNYNYKGGLFTASGGTVTYNGIENQNIGRVAYNNLKIDKSAAEAFFVDTTVVSGNFAVVNGEVDNLSRTSIGGDVSIYPGAIFENLSILHVGGNWTNNGTFTGNGAGIYFDGIGTQTISATTFNNFTIDKPVGAVAVLTGDVAIKSDFNVHSGTFDIKSFNCNRTTQGGTLTLGDSATFIVGGNNSPLYFSNGDLSNSSTVIANGATTQIIFGVDFGHLVFQNSGPKILVAPINIHGNLTIDTGASFDGGSQVLTIGGNWINKGSFTPSTGTILLTGTSKVISGNTTFDNLKVLGSYTILNDVVFNGLLDITSGGSISGGPTVHTTLNGDLINSGVLYSLGTTTFSGNVLQTLSLINAVNTVAITVNFNGSVSPVLNSTSVPQFGFLNINNTGGINPSVGWNILYALNVGSGAFFNGGPSIHNLQGSLTNNGTITSTGTINFTPSSTSTLNLGSNFSSTGLVNFGGTAASTVTGGPAWFKDVLISNTNAVGIGPSAGWSISNNLTINAGSVFNSGSYTHLLGGNLLNDGTLNSGTSVIKLNGHHTQDIRSGNSLYGLVINKDSGITTLSTDVMVTDTLRFIKGLIQTGAQLLLQPSTGTSVGAAQSTGWVNGNLQKGISNGDIIKNYEIGDSLHYSPVSISLAAVTSAGNLTAFTTIGDHPDIANSKMNVARTVNRFWTIINSGVVFTDYNARFSFPVSDRDSGIITSGLQAALQNAGVWSYPIIGTQDSNAVQITGQSLFGDVQLGMYTPILPPPVFGAATNFAVLAATTVTATGTGFVSGNVGVSPGTSATGFPPIIIQNGQIYTGGGSIANAAQVDAQLIYYDLVARASIPANNLSGMLLGTTPGAVTLSPGVYKFNSSAQLDGTLNLNDGGDSDAVFIFQIGSTLTSSTGAEVIMSSGGRGKNVFWQVGSSASIGISTKLAGHILAYTSITMNPGSSTTGRLIALGAAVTMSSADVKVLDTFKTWDGGAGTHNWGDAANWNNDGVPTANDNIILNGADSIDINVTATTKSLRINNDSLRLSINSGESLTVAGNLNLDSGSLTTAAGFPIVSGTVDLTGGTMGFSGMGIQTIPAYQYKNLKSSSTGARIFASTGTISISGIFSAGTNAYVAGGSTIEFNGSGNQAIPAQNYNNLHLSHTGVKMFSQDTTGISGVFSISDSASGNAVTDSSTISYNGTIDQSLMALPYYNVDVNKPGSTLFVNDAAIAGDLSVRNGAIIIGNSDSSRTIVIGGDILIESGASCMVAVTSNTIHNLIASGDLINNGVLDLHPDSNSSCNVRFNRDGIQTISGIGTTNRFNRITTDMGSSSNNYLEMAALNFSVPDGFLSLINGSFNLNNPGIRIKPFLADISTGGFLIPEHAGLWVTTGTIDSVNMNWTVAGVVKVAGGAFYMGSRADNVVIPKSSAYFAITGGNLIMASRLSNPGIPWTMDLKVGTLTLNTKGSTAADIAPFNLDATDGIFNMSGGLLIIHKPGGAIGQHLAFNNLATTGPGFAGGTLQLGDTATPVGALMEIHSSSPIHNLVLGSAHVTAILTSDLQVSNDLTIGNGVLDIDTFSLSIGGNVSNSGVFKAGFGTVEMDGAAAQTILSGTFTGDTLRNLIVNNQAGVTLQSAIGLSGRLLVSSGQLHADGNLTLLSTPIGTAFVDGSGTGDVLGKVTMQRFLPRTFGYRYYSSPFQGAKVSELADDVDLNASFSAIYRYDESQASTGWLRYTDTSNVLQPLSGYTVNTGTDSVAGNVDISGIVNNGEIDATLYNHNQPYTLGFNLVGNPYPSPVDWDLTSGWSRSNIDNGVYYFNPGNSNQYTGSYSSYVNGISSDGVAGNIIASMQGFFVHVSNGSYPVMAALGVNNAARLNLLSPGFHKPTRNTAPLVRLSAAFADEQGANDNTVVYFDNTADRKFNREKDALKLMNTDASIPNFYVLAPDAARLSVCAWPSIPDQSDNIPLGLQLLRSGWVSFKAPEISNLPAGNHLYLLDAVAGVAHDVADHLNYRLFLNAGIYENRFSLALSTIVLSGTGIGTNAYTYAGHLYIHINQLPGELLEVRVTNLLGQEVYAGHFTGSGEFKTGGQFTTGMYLVTCSSQHQQSSQKVFIGN